MMIVLEPPILYSLQQKNNKLYQTHKSGRFETSNLPFSFSYELILISNAF